MRYHIDQENVFVYERSAPDHITRFVDWTVSHLLWLFGYDIYGQPIRVDAARVPQAAK
jgi:hypothetical protein